MGSKSKQKQKERQDVALQNYNEGVDLVCRHPVFSPLASHTAIQRNDDGRYPQNGLAVVTNNGRIYCNPKIRALPGEWSRALAHCLLHLGMGHFQKTEDPVAWNIACDCVVEKFLDGLKFGKTIDGRPAPMGTASEEKLYRQFLRDGIKLEYHGFGTAGDNARDMVFEKQDHSYFYSPTLSDYPKYFAAGLANAVKSAVNVASGRQSTLLSDKNGTVISPEEAAKQWFVSSYPLLGAVAANFKLVKDPQTCLRMQVHTAAVSVALSELYLNPAAGLSRAELRFVMAHEFLHAALRHDARIQWRDAYLWNVACDFVINQWLTEMGVGERPPGGLFDEQFKGMSAEAVYDRIATDMRRYRKLATLRGVGLGDIIAGEERPPDTRGDVNLDAFYRRAIAEGLEYHNEQGRGYLPAGLVEEIRALSHPPIEWDVELARWFDEHFTPVEKKRSYARPSRRQSATPDIPRPSWVVSQTALDGRTFGVVLDSSGSMERGLLAKALGAIASYAASRDVPAARVVFCDAQAYDQNYMRPEDIADTVKVKGRGGTVLQPGITLLLRAEDFPKDAPILVITDAGCENRLVFEGREHAFLVPQGANLPFIAKGKVFRMR